MDFKIESMIRRNYTVRILREGSTAKDALPPEPLPGAVVESQKKLAESHSALLHERVSALADFLQRHF